MNTPTNQEHRETAGAQPADARPEATSAPTVDPHADIRASLLRAATGAAELGIELDLFMSNAWHAYMQARPGLREKLEDMQLAAQVQELRQKGRVGQA